MVSYETTYLKVKENENNTVDLTFIDKEKYLNITIPSLEYDQTLMSRFINAQPKDSSFAMMVGVKGRDNGLPIVVPTRDPEVYPILSLRGFLN
jgi:hypothetical protein